MEGHTTIRSRTSMGLSFFLTLLWQGLPFDLLLKSFGDHVRRRSALRFSVGIGQSGKDWAPVLVAMKVKWIHKRIKN